MFYNHNIREVNLFLDGAEIEFHYFWKLPLKWINYLKKEDNLTEKDIHPKLVVINKINHFLLVN